MYTLYRSTRGGISLPEMKRCQQKLFNSRLIQTPSIPGLSFPAANSMSVKRNTKHASQPKSYKSTICLCHLWVYSFKRLSCFFFGMGITLRYLHPGNEVKRLNEMLVNVGGGGGGGRGGGVDDQENKAHDEEYKFL